MDIVIILQMVSWGVVSESAALRRWVLNPGKYARKDGIGAIGGNDLGIWGFPEDGTASGLR
jgi:hypothetical protein